MARMPRNQLLDQLFALFRETLRWSIRPLREKTQQPEVYLKEVLCRLYDSEQRQRRILFLFSFCLVISPFLPPIRRMYIYLSTHSAIRCICIQHRYRQQARKTGRHCYVKSLECFHSAITTYWLALLLLKLSITNHIQLVSEVTISIVSRFRNISGKFFECTNKQEISQLTDSYSNSHTNLFCGPSRCVAAYTRCCFSYTVHLVLI